MAQTPSVVGTRGGSGDGEVWVCVRWMVHGKEREEEGYDNASALWHGDAEEEDGAELDFDGGDVGGGWG